jgi:UDP-N-acetyl-D-mannosaminuronic acid transferase (WecB/TagA/CpsF family)
MKNIYVKKKILFFYQIKFYDWNFDKIINTIKGGGYVVAPAASALVEIEKNITYYESLKNSTCAIFDSGFFCIILRIFFIYNPKKFSGYLFLKKFIDYEYAKNKKILLINSSNKQGELNKKLLSKKKFKKVFLYTAPIYNENKIIDQEVINYIKKKKPYYIIINIGGLKQEPLAFFINSNIKFKCRIFCLGGAIDFITGLQAPINEFIDKIYLGWLLRIIFKPNIFFIRVLRSLNLLKFFLYEINLRDKFK